MTRFLFFAGKGGVGKTSMACATGVHMADSGKSTLIVTTDPASNLADVFEQPIGHKITPIQGVNNLWAMEIDPDQATFEYKERALAPLRALFPAEIVKVMEEQMASPCTAEVAAFDRFTDFIDNPSSNSQSFDIVIFDTAPTGHTLRLLELPAEWSRSIESTIQTGGLTCIGPAAAIQEQKAKYDRAIRTLIDPSQTEFTFVLQPEASAIRETERSIAELRKLGIDNFQIIINGVIPPTETSNPFLQQRAMMQKSHIDEIQRRLPLPSKIIYLFDSELKGAARLRKVVSMLFGESRDYRLASETETSGSSTQNRTFHVNQKDSAGKSSVLTRILPQGKRRTIFFAGKGGVGKTVLSCATAVWLARRGYRTLLLTTDPAEHISDVLETRVTDTPTPYQGLYHGESIPQLYITKIDAKAAAQAYKARILEDARQKGRSPEAIASMEEELNSPCTEEMAAFDKFIDYASQDGWDAIVFDTAPTGHTLRLLELPVDWSKQIQVKIFASVDSAAADDVAKRRFGEVIDMMRDPERCTFAFVMYPESTPIIESYRAIQELGTVGIKAGLIIANQVIPDDVCTTEYARARWTMQHKYLKEMEERFTAPILTVPLLPREVSGLDTLISIGEHLFGPAEKGRDNQRVSVSIFGVPVMCAEGITDPWRNAASLVRNRLISRFGDKVTVEYHDLMSPEMDNFPEVLKEVNAGSQVPLVFINNSLFSSGGKVSIPAIAEKVRDLLGL